MGSKVIELKPLDIKGDIIRLGVGRHTIGRGPLLRCADKHISRNHAVIDIKADGSILLESTHANPCFYQKMGQANPVTLTKFNSQEIQVGDKFSLMPFNFTYEIYSNSIIEKESGENDKVTPIKNLSTDKTKLLSKSEDVESLKHTENAVTIEVMKKRISSEQSGNRKRILPSWLTELANQNMDEGDEKPSGSSKKVREKKVLTVTEKKASETSDEGTSKNVEKKTSPKARNMNIEGDKKQPAAAEKKRRSCRFGAKCYRKNPVHFQEESHPGDADYVSPSTSDTEVTNKDDDDDDDDDKRPECEYGINCYRKNPQHRKQYKHTHVPRPPRTAAKKAKAKNKTLQSDDEDDDFIIDDDSDVYNPESDADTEDDVETLLAEANEFKRNKKMLKPT